MALKRSTETNSTVVMNQNNGELMRLTDQAIREVLFDMNNPYKSETKKRKIIITLELTAVNTTDMIVSGEVTTKLAPFDRTPEPQAPNGQMNIFDQEDQGPVNQNMIDYDVDEDDERDADDLLEEMD